MGNRWRCAQGTTASHRSPCTRIARGALTWASTRCTLVHPCHDLAFDDEGLLALPRRFVALQSLGRHKLRGCTMPHEPDESECASANTLDGVNILKRNVQRRERVVVPERLAQTRSVRIAGVDGRVSVGSSRWQRTTRCISNPSTWYPWLSNVCSHLLNIAEFGTVAVVQSPISYLLKSIGADRVIPQSLPPPRAPQPPSLPSAHSRQHVRAQEEEVACGHDEADQGHRVGHFEDRGRVRQHPRSVRVAQQRGGISHRRRSFHPPSSELRAPST